MNPSIPPAAEVPLPYRGAPIGDVVASEAALRSLKKTRPWALLCAIGMLTYALFGGGVGCMWLFVVIIKYGEPGFPLSKFVVLVPPNLIGAPLALVGGLLAIRYYHAAGRAHDGRSSEDLERALIAQGHIWRWASLTVIALFALPVIIVGLGSILGAWR